MTAALAFWCVYEKPSDYPEHWVIRRFTGTQPTEEVIVGETLAQVRGMLRRQHPDLVRFTRSERDDPRIIEVWL